MHEFETFVFLDVQKTGTTFIVRFLREFCTEKELRKRLHNCVSGDYDPNKFHFISVRNPLDQYVSLYSYGSERKGPLYKKFVLQGHGDLYAGSWGGFKSWLDFALAPENAGYLSRAYAAAGSGETHKLIGFQTYRFLELALQDALETLERCHTRDDIRKAYAEKKMANFIIHHETYRQDVEELLTTRIHKSISDVEGALKFLNEADRINVSDRIDKFETDPKVGPKNKQNLRDREWFMREMFDY